jgi:hypothetical protein
VTLKPALHHPANIGQMRGSIDLSPTKPFHNAEQNQQKSLE